FVDLMVIDGDTFGFLMALFPRLGRAVTVAAVLAVPSFALLWWLDPVRVRRRMACLGGSTCPVLLTALSFAVPHDREEEFWDENYVSKFARSGATALADLMVHGVLDADATVAERLSAGAAEECRPKDRPPHIVMILDESSFDASTVPGAKLPP